MSHTSQGNKKSPPYRLWVDARTGENEAQKDTQMSCHEEGLSLVVEMAQEIPLSLETQRTTEPREVTSYSLEGIREVFLKCLHQVKKDLPAPISTQMLSMSAVYRMVLQTSVPYPNHS